jgi:SAM-dependent methyltransferase
VESDLRSARILVDTLGPIIRPGSVLDIGCGLGHFCRVFLESGVDRVLGVDGDYLDRSKLLIPQDHFKSLDLSVPFDLGEKFDLVISLEVAEHLPEVAADEFIASLVRHGETVLFSAAFPGQGGQKHLNEQWARWWASKFLSHGYHAYDLLRPQVFDNPNLPPWYRFNPLVFSRKNPLPSGPMKVDFFEHVLTGGLGIKLSLRCLVAAFKRKFAH